MTTSQRNSPGNRDGGHVTRLRRSLPAQADTEALGREIALFARVGDWILLFGELGTGKTTLARAFIRAMLPPGVAERTEVPSPTFTLVQPYEATRVPVAHVDLYRIADPFEVDELGLDELARDHVMIVEWPDRLPALPPHRLEVYLEDADDGRSRVAELIGHGDWAARLDRMETVWRFLQEAARRLAPEADMSSVERRFLQGDASARRYERVRLSGRPPMILMDMPERPDGPPLRNGKSYDELVHLARSVRAVYAIDTELLARGYSAPEICAHDFAHGLLLLEDLGDLTFGRLYAEGRMEEPLRAATEVLIDMAGREWPREVALPEGPPHRVHDYDAEAFLVEAELLIDWFWPHVRAGAACSADVRAAYAEVVRAMLAFAQPESERPVWVLRDYHSPNLIWLPEREGLRRVGLIDTQDAVMGPAAYDLASLLQDARITVPEPLEREMLAHYCAARAAAEPAFDEAAFRLSYAVMGAQRALKVLGIFARLKERDGKPQYLAHLPRVAFWLRRNLARRESLPGAGAAALAAMEAWLDEQLPEVGALADEFRAQTKS